jgi:hypothetical protein
LLGLIVIPAGAAWWPAAATPAMAQSMSRSIMSRSSDDGGMQTLTYAVPDRAELTAPDLRPADLPQVIARLDLSEAQAAVVADLIRVYADAVAALPLAVPEEGRGLLDEEDQAGPDAGSDPMSSAVRETMKEFGFDPARLDGELSVGIGISVGMGRTEDGAPPSVQVQANVTIGPGEGRTLPKEEMERLQQVADAAARKIEGLAREQAMRDLQRQEQGGPAAGDDQWDMLAERAQAMRDSVRTYRRERTRLRQRLDADIQTLLARPQMERWPAFDRWVLRNRALPMGRLAGESLDVFAAIETLVEQRPAAAEPIESIATDLEIRLHELLARRDDQVIDIAMAIDEASHAGDAAEIRRLALRQRDLHVRVRDANLDAIDLLGAVLAELSAEPDPFGGADAAASASDSADDPSSAAATPATAPRNLGERVRRELRRQAFPMVWAVTPAQRSFAAVGDLPLTEGQREVLEQVARDYAIEHETTSRRIEALVIRHQPDGISGAYDSILESLGAEPIVPPMPARRQPDDGDEPGMVIMLTPQGPVAEALERRLALDKRTMQRLYGMFDASTVAALPPLPDVADLAPAEGLAGDGFVGVRRGEDD